MELIATAALQSLKEEGDCRRTERYTKVKHEEKRGSEGREDAEEALNVPEVGATATFQPQGARRSHTLINQDAYGRAKV